MMSAAAELVVSDHVTRHNPDHAHTSGAGDSTDDVRAAVTSRRMSTGDQQHVEFSAETDNVNVNDEQSSARGRFLTAKYPKHQMGLIRRRLGVEDWIDEQLKLLFDVGDDDYTTYDVELELDDVLNIDTDDDRAAFIREKIAHAPKSDEIQNKFVEELVQKSASL